ncbi:hypothetical protein TWF730_007393 [Orbilia blumenaviensis]|uniref:Uncharacterized protein n=1 Tax=Orbilia blumenaviensis TaxID=1796055 RepID=A0AAV9V9Z7_9PEZI
MSASVQSDENTVPEKPVIPTVSVFSETGPDGRESPQGFTHPAYFRPGPIKIEKQPHLLTLDNVKQWQSEVKTPTSPLTAHPVDGDSYWPPELVNKHHSPSSGRYSHNFTDPSVSTGSPTSIHIPIFQAPTIQVTKGGAAGEPAKPTQEPPKVTRQRSERMWNFTNIDETEERTLVPEKLLYDREIELWRSDVIRNGASMVGIQDGITIFCRKMGEPKPNPVIFNTFGAFIDESIAQLVDVKKYYEEHHHHHHEVENELLRSQLASYKRILEQKNARIRELEKPVEEKCGSPDRE